jgi:tetratricopeptide (TPR) repeat protein
MKKSAITVLLLAAAAIAQAADKYTPLGGNSLANELQWLTAQTACAGQYNMAQTGDYSIGDPHDYYRPADIREYLARQSGGRTATTTFYGICFDYAQAAYNHISGNRAAYEAKGMKRNGWYIVGTGNNSRQITLYDPSSREQATLRMNGVYIKENSRQNVQAHGNATVHAWLWVYGNDGTIYWIDPTWTDTAGYIWWGVVENGREVQRGSSQRLSAVTLPQAEGRRGNEILALFNSATANMKQKRYDQAIADYTAFLRIHSGYAFAYISHGDAYKEKGDYDRAIADYTQVISLYPNAVHARIAALAYCYRGNVYRRNKNDYDQAIADYTQAVRLDPNDAYAYYSRGNAYSDKNDYDRAIADYDQAIRLDPNDIYVYNERAYAYKGKEMLDRAIEDLNTALRIDPNSAYIYDSRGEMYLAKRDYDRAIADYKRAVRMDPDEQLYKDNLQAARNAKAQGR